MRAVILAALLCACSKPAPTVVEKCQQVADRYCCAISTFPDPSDPDFVFAHDVCIYSATRACDGVDSAYWFGSDVDFGACHEALNEWPTSCIVACLGGDEYPDCHPYPDACTSGDCYEPGVECEMVQIEPQD